MPLPSLDSRQFRLVSSSNSAVNDNAPSIFEFHERAGIVWSEYGGDTVTVGRGVGVRDGDTLREWFVHRLVSDGSVVSGNNTSELREADGRLELVESFTINGEALESVCIELDDAESARWAPALVVPDDAGTGAAQDDAQPSLDGRRFVLRSSTASVVNTSKPSTFDYHEHGGLIWGEYWGDTVTFGRFIGTRSGATISVVFAHELVADSRVVSGSSDSTIRVENGELTLVEDF
ncbi:MAG: hypothetical protein ACTJHU_05295, partial [Mycetocola sp.]